MRHQHGLSLIEVMIALVLGLIVVGAAGAIFISNKRVYATTESVARIQENTRVAFELMARDMREAGGLPCKRDPANFRSFVNQGEESAWWLQWFEGMHGYDGTVAGQPANRVAGTDMIEVGSAFTGDYFVSDKESNDTSANLRLNKVEGIVEGEIVVVCDSQKTAMFQVTGVNDSIVALQHNSGASIVPGNCNKKFLFDGTRGSTSRCSNGGSGYLFPMGAQVVKVDSTRWFVGTNGRGGSSLYRQSLSKANTAPDAAPTAAAAQEIAEGVANLQIEYIEPTDVAYGNAATVTNWSNVSAARIILTMQVAQGALAGREIQGTDNQVLGRQFSHIVSIRNHNP